MSSPLLLLLLLAATAPTVDSLPMTPGCHGLLLIMEKMGNFFKNNRIGPMLLLMMIV
jgi:hypothetical protein